MPGQLAARETPFGWQVNSPAKVNVSLEVLSKRPDGFHEVRTLLAPVRWGDQLCFAPTEESSLSLSVRNTLPTSVCPPAPADDRNLVIRALRALQSATGCQAGGQISLVKRIPSEAGLGGGSGNAAAALIAANLGWGLGLSMGQLTRIAGTIGSDVPAMLSPEASLCQGRGEVLSSLPLPGGIPMVLAKNGPGLSTPAVFSRWKPAAEHCHRGEDLPQQIAAAFWQGAPRKAGRLMVNHLQPVAQQLSDSLKRLMQLFEELPLIAWQMTGSGSALLGICSSQHQATRVAHWLRNRGVAWTVATCTC